MWEPRRLTTLWASTACYKESFTFFYEVNHKESSTEISADCMLILIRCCLSVHATCSCPVFRILWMLLYGMKPGISAKNWLCVVTSQVDAALTPKTPILWDIPPCSLVDGYWRFGRTCCLYFCRRDGLSRLSRNVGNQIPDYTVSRTRRPQAFVRRSTAVLQFKFHAS
jgi:hypothetical protein